MDVLKRTDLRELVEQDGKWHVSLYMPTYRAGRDQQQGPIRLKNLARLRLRLTRKKGGSRLWEQDRGGITVSTAPHEAVR